MAFFLATRQDKPQVVKVLTEAFAGDPHLDWIIGSSKRRELRARTLMAYAFEYGFRQNQVYLTENRQAVAIWKVRGVKTLSLPFIRANLSMLWHFGISDIIRITSFDKKVEQRRDQTDEDFYLWFLGTIPRYHGRGLAQSLLESRLQSADVSDKWIYLETAKLKNVEFYRRRGFELFDQMTAPDSPDTIIYFMKRAPQPERDKKGLGGVR